MYSILNTAATALAVAITFAQNSLASPAVNTTTINNSTFFLPKRYILELANEVSYNVNLVDIQFCSEVVLTFVILRRPILLIAFIPAAYQVLLVSSEMGFSPAATIRLLFL